MSALPDAWAPENGPESGSVIIDGEPFSPEQVREYANQLLLLADFAAEHG